MDILSGIALIASPFLITFITNVVKKAKAKDWSNPVRVTTLRAIVAVLSFGAVVGSSLINGTEVETSAISQFSDTIVMFVASTGLYFWQNRKK